MTWLLRMMNVLGTAAEGGVPTSVGTSSGGHIVWHFFCFRIGINAAAVVVQLWMVSPVEASLRGLEVDACTGRVLCSNRKGGVFLAVIGQCIPSAGPAL